tara:strand:+ start:57 stop:1166 length:1110 start_codon:yes stop_codon:yes gene_type:complete
MVSNARQLAQVPSAPSERRNLIINGAMDVHQRGGTISAVNAAIYTLDRFITIRGSSYNFDVDISQSSEAPDGFANSLKIDVQATATPSGSENFGFEQKIESQNTTHLNYGSSSGKYIVLSFWVRSGKTGTYGLQLVHNGKSRNFVSSYTIDSANTWENKTIVINPDTAGSSAFVDGTGAGLRIVWHLSTGADDLLSGNRDWTDDGSFRSVTGQANLLDSTSNEFYITGVQLEIGTVATDFEHRSYAEELQLCQRYFEYASELYLKAHPIWFYGDTNAATRLHLVVPKRSNSYTVGYAGTIGTGSSDHRVYYSGAYRAFSAMTFSSTAKARKSVRVDFTTITGGSAGGAGGYYNLGSSTVASHIYVDDEL